MSMEQVEPAEVRAVKRLDIWLESMRNQDGYTGPVVHWWQHSLQYTGVGLDWRYEGIILGYLNLYKQSGNFKWLEKACRAGDDIVRGQLSSGNYINSNFEANPYPGGTPHEPACDIGLIALAKVLKENLDSTWKKYAETANRNIHDFLIAKLWHSDGQYFCNDPFSSLFVLNKAATIVEVLFAWTELHEKPNLIELYGKPTLDAIVKFQFNKPGHFLDGAFDQGFQGSKPTGRFFPFYIARCIPALVLGYNYWKDERYMRAARNALSFILRAILPDGSLPQVIYHNKRITRYPQWIAGAGDILRAMRTMQQHGIDVPTNQTHYWLLQGFKDSPGCFTARGFASQGSQKKPSSTPDFLDILPVCGWVDKAFRYLTDFITQNIDPEPKEFSIVDIPCVYKGSSAHYYEDEDWIEVTQGSKIAYRWGKGNNWAETIY